MYMYVCPAAIAGLVPLALWVNCGVKDFAGKTDNLPEYAVPFTIEQYKAAVADMELWSILIDAKIAQE